MVFVDLLCSINATENGRTKKILQHAAQGLEHDEDNRREPEDSVRRVKVRMVALVDLDDDESTQETEDTEELDGKVDARSQSLLLRGYCWLEDECRLDLEEDCGRSEKLGEVSRVEAWKSMDLLDEE